MPGPSVAVSGPPNRTIVLGVLGVALTAATGILAARCARSPVSEFTGEQQPPPPTQPAPFSHWPQGKKPDAVLVLSGQVFGFLKPCGCTPIQYGGLERRSNLFTSLREKGWPVVGLDLGDLTGESEPGHAVQMLPEQIQLKYKYMLLAMKQLGYAAAGVGEREFAQHLYPLLGQFTIQKPNEPPILLAANTAGTGEGGKLVPREEHFKTGVPTDRPMIEDCEVVTVGAVPVGVVGAVGPSTAAAITKADPSFPFINDTDAIRAALAKLAKHAKAPALKVLLYQGTLDEAKAIAKTFPEFRIIVCKIEQSLPPSFPTYANNDKMLIVQVGHKGQNMGVVGAFKTSTGFDLYYQLIELGPPWDTPAAKVPQDKAVALLQKYAEEVKKENFLAKAAAKKDPHANQVRFPDQKLTYVGAAVCKQCHPNEHGVWEKTSHSHAMDALEKVATKPTLRNFDPECVVCHVVGLRVQSGFESKEKTPQLAHVGCESCHGPGSGHAANKDNMELRLALSPWKTKPTDRLPDLELLKAIAAKPAIDRGPLEAKLTAQQRAVVNAVDKACVQCHDHDNDPKFNVYEFLPKIWHSGFKANPGLPPIAK
jgi:hypothetical protein